jgi:hypothetical protein
MFRAGVLMIAVLTGAGAGAAQAQEIRPPSRVLRLSERDVLLRFTPEVQKDANLRLRAVSLWRMHFATQARAIERRFAVADDWRPALADAAELVDEFLEASLLPRQGEWQAGEDQVWVESLDPRTGQRVRTRRAAKPTRAIFAPTDEKPSNPADQGLKQDAAPKQSPSR